MGSETVSIDPARISDSALKSRMRDRLEELRWTLEELSGRTGESYSNIRNWVSGQTRVPATFLAKYAEVVPVNPTWLLTGRGTPAPLEEGTADLLFQLFNGIAGMAGRSGVTNQQLRDRLVDMIVLLEDAERG